MLSANFKPKRIAAASRGFLAIARLSCFTCNHGLTVLLISAQIDFTRFPSWTICNRRFSYYFHYTKCVYYRNDNNFSIGFFMVSASWMFGLLWFGLFSFRPFGHLWSTTQREWIVFLSLLSICDIFYRLFDIVSFFFTCLFRLRYPISDIQLMRST